MTPKEKAQELYDRYNPHCAVLNYYGDNIEIQSTKKCALIAVDEILNILNIWSALHLEKSSQLIFWEEVKQEIEKL